MNGDITRARILDAVRALSGRRPPTVRAIAEHIGSSSGNVYFHLSILRQQGHIEPADGHAGILLAEESAT